jgi:chromosome segregation ATPase
MSTDAQPSTVDPDVAAVEQRIATEERRGRAELESLAKADERKSGKVIAKKTKDIEDIVKNSKATDGSKVDALVSHAMGALRAAQESDRDFLRVSRELEQSQRERELIALELQRSLDKQSKLSQLSRHLQAQVKTLEDAEKVRNLQNDSFTQKLADIQKSIAAHDEGSRKVHEENERLRGELTRILEHTDKLNAHSEAVQKKLELEKQLAEARLAQQTGINEKQQALMEAALAQTEAQAKRCDHLEAENASLREKFNDTMGLVSRSTEAFKEYKANIDTLSKSARDNEKEAADAKAALAEYQKALPVFEGKIASLAKKNETLVQLCRTLKEQNEALTRAKEGQQQQQQ